MSAPLSPRDLVFGFTPISDAELAPDGESVVYMLWRTEESAPGQGGESHTAHVRVGGTHADLWLCRRDGSHARPLTTNGAAASPRFAPSGRTIAFVSADTDGSDICLVDLADLRTRRMARHDGAVGELDWSPDENTLAFVALADGTRDDQADLRGDRAHDVNDEIRVVNRLDYREDGRGFLGDLRHHVFTVDMATGETRRLSNGPYDHETPRWSPDGRSIACRARTGGWTSQLALIDPETGETQRIGPEVGAVAHFTWSHDGKQIVICGASRLSTDAFQWDFFVYDLATGSLRQVTDERDFAIVADPAWLDERTVVFHAVHAGASQVLRLDTTTGETVQVVAFEALNHGFSADRECRWAVQVYESPDQVAELVVIDLSSGATDIVTSYSSDLLARSPQASWEKLTVERDGVEIDAWLLLPPDLDESKQYPIVLDVHGGPQRYYGYGFDLAQQCLATHGHLVVYANPRGSSSYARAFTRHLDSDWIDDPYLDLLAVVDAVGQKAFADPDRVGIVGYSYGGYVTTWAIGQSARFKAAVCGAPLFDMDSWWGTSDVNLEVVNEGWPGAPHESREWYEANSPSTFAHRATTPTLILHGEEDHRVPIGQSEHLFTILKSVGCETEFVRYVGGPHMWFHAAQGSPEQRVDVLERTLEWFSRHLGGAR